MKKIILAATTLMLFAISNTAEARRYSQNTQYSAQYENYYNNPLEELFGGSDWNVSPQPHYGWRKHAHSYYNTYQRHYAGRPSSSIVAFGRMLQHEGIRVSEHPAFGGVHHVHHGHGHYAGRAIDINVGRGVNEASSPRARHWFDGIASRARAAGYMVLWKVAGHFNHMHIEKR